MTNEEVELLNAHIAQMPREEKDEFLKQIHLNSRKAAEDKLKEIKNNPHE